MHGRHHCGRTRRWAVCALAVVAALVAPAVAHASGTAVRIGTVEDEVLADDLVTTKTNMTLLRLAGLDSIRVTALWGPTQREPSETDAPKFDHLATAARLSGVRLYVAVMHKGSATTPLSETDQADFAAYAASLARRFPAFRHFIIGNEPNLNRFWLPQFDEAGADLAAPAYLQLLAKTYDALKAVSRTVTVIGGALAPRGIDRPGSGRDTHSPTTFIRDMGTAYRESARRRPVMDSFAIHPYGDSSSQSPLNSAHPRTSSVGLADYDKLVRLLGEAFDGTAQLGSQLPILYAEYGVETTVPERKAALYDGTEPTPTRPVSEATQALYYRQAIGMAFCQRNVQGILLLHALDERARPGWQSGLFWADRTPKTSLRRVAAAAAESRRGIVAACPQVFLTPQATRVIWSRAVSETPRRLSAQVRCSIDCAWHAQLEQARTGDAVATTTGQIVAGRLARIAVPVPKTAAGRLRLRLMLVAPRNPGPARWLTGPTVTVAAAARAATVPAVPVIG